MGLVAKSKAPLFMAERMLPMSPYADTMIHLSAGLRISLILVSSVSPSISGMLMSLRMMSKSFFSSTICRASSPLWAKENSYSPFLIFRLKYWVSSISRSCSSSTLNILIAIIMLGLSGDNNFKGPVVNTVAKVMIISQRRQCFCCFFSEIPFFCLFSHHPDIVQARSQGLF